MRASLHNVYACVRLQLTLSAALLLACVANVALVCAWLYRAVMLRHGSPLDASLRPPIMLKRQAPRPVGAEATGGWR